jgi:hypothetical protein
MHPALDSPQRALVFESLWFGSQAGCSTCDGAPEWQTAHYVPARSLIDLEFTKTNALVKRLRLFMARSHRQLQNQEVFGARALIATREDQRILGRVVNNEKKLGSRERA